VEAFDQIAQKHPNAPEPFFYLGVSHLFLGEADQAVPALQKARELDSEALNRDIAWYLGIAEFRRQKSEAAEAEFRRLCDEPGAHRDNACAVVNELSKVLK
jgi:cytochrome c-type biogenesis protein CcmH/NrfG